MSTATWQSVAMTSSRVAAGRTLLVAFGLVALGNQAVSAPPNSPTATVAARRVAAPPRTFSVAATGDVLTEDLVNQSAARSAAPGQRFDFAPLFAPIAPIISSADLAICHMEIPIGQPGARPGIYGRSPFGGNLLLAPYEIAAGLASTGFDRCTTASNHSNDLGVDGIDSTLDVLDTFGISHVGTARSPAEAIAPILHINGIRVAHLSYSRGSNTVLPQPTWRLNAVPSVQQVAADVVDARARGAEVVIVSIHILHELERGPIPADRAFVTDLTAAAPIDLIIEHGPHVIQPVETVNGTPVFWSVGNLVSGMGRPGTGRYEDPRSADGLIATARFTAVPGQRFHVDVMPVLICDEYSARTVYPALTTLNDPTISADLRGQLQRCLARSTPVVADLG